MATINVNGQGGGSPQGQPRQGVVNDQTFARMQSEMARQQGTSSSSSSVDADYDRALRQRTQQINAENRAWKQQQAREDRLQRERDRSVQAEIRSNDARVRQDASLQQRFRMLESRARQPLTPSSWNTVQRSISSLQFAARGSGAIPGQAFNRLRTSTGSEADAFGVARSLRMGNVGQRMGYERDWTGLAKIQGELRRIEATLTKSEKFATSPSAQASLQRQKDALLTARTRISQGLAGNSPLTNTIGQGYGAIRAGLSNPVVSTVLDAALATVGAPYLANKAYAGYIGQQRPYLDFSRSVKDLGRGGGFNSADLMGQIYPSGAGSFIPRPGMGRSAGMQSLGLGPQDVLTNLRNYGVSPTSGSDAFNIAASVRREYLGGSGLSEEALGKYLGTGRNLGEVAGGPSFNMTASQYWNQLERVMTAASAAGIDRSRMVSVFTQLQQQSPGLNTNSQGFSNTISRMLDSGAPGARSGVDIMGFVHSVDKTMGGLGTEKAMGANIIFSELMQKNGGAPRDEESLRNFLHVDKKDWSHNYVATPASQRAMKDYFEAVQKNDPAALRFLGQLLTGHPDEVNSMLESSPTFKSLTGYQQDIVRSNVLQSTLGQSVEFGSSKATAGNAPGGSFQQRAELERARLQRDLGLTPAQSAGLAGALAGEGLSTGNEVGKAPGTGGFGLAQWTGSRRADFFKWAQSQGRDPSSYDAQQDYLEQELQTKYPKVLANLKNANNVDDATRASLPYLFGDGSTPDSAGLYNAHGGERMQMARGIYTGYTSNSPLPELNKGADAQVANTKAAEYVNNVSDTVTAGFTRMVHAGDEVVAMFQRLSGAGNAHAAQRMPGGFMSPDGLWVPLSTQSGGALK